MIKKFITVVLACTVVFASLVVAPSSSEAVRIRRRLKPERKIEPPDSSAHRAAPRERLRYFEGLRTLGSARKKIGREVRDPESISRIVGSNAWRAALGTFGAGATLTGVVTIGLGTLFIVGLGATGAGAFAIGGGILEIGLGALLIRKAVRG